MQKTKLPYYQLLLATLLGGAISFIAIKVFENKTVDTVRAATKADDCSYDIKTRGGFPYIRPLLLAEKECEAAELQPMKEGIEKLVDAKKGSGGASSVSVYVRSLAKGGWICYNEGAVYHPASLNKIATLITYMRAAENAPGLLEQKIEFKGHDVNAGTYSGKTLEQGKSYAVKDLLHYMIAYSDNESTMLLLKHVRPEFHFKTYTDLGLPKPDAMTGIAQVTAKDFSVFMNVIYSASYLSANSSEYCSELLTECDFKDGIVKPLPANIKVAHKFGEFRDGNEYELHESAVVYNGDRPYLIVVMTKGPERQQLADVISEISDYVYSSFQQSPNL